MTEIILRKELFGLVPTEEEGEGALRGIALGDCVKAKISRPRNLQHHRLFFALMQTIFANQERYQSLDHLVAAFKLAIGHVDVIRTKRGDVEIPKSIAFSNMDQDEFRKFFDRAVDFVLAEVVPGLNREELEREVLEMVGRP